MNGSVRLSAILNVFVLHLYISLNFVLKKMKMNFFKKYCMDTWNQALIFATLKNCWYYWNLNSFSPAYGIVWILLIKQIWLFIKINKLKISIGNVKPTHYSPTSLIVSLEMEIKRTLNSLFMYLQFRECTIN